MYCCIQPLLSTVVTNSVTSQPLKQPQQQPLKIALSLYIYLFSQYFAPGKTHIFLNEKSLVNVLFSSLWSENLFDDVKKSVGIQKWSDETNQLIYLHLDIFLCFFSRYFCASTKANHGEGSERLCYAERRGRGIREECTGWVAFL